jgi:tetratricopeptide (TPR) repeat protein
VLKEEFEDYKMMRNSLVKRFNVKTDLQLLKHLEKYGDEYFKGRDEKKTKGGGPHFRSFRFAFSIAASFLILFGMVWGFKMQVQDTFSPTNLAKNSQIQIVELYKSNASEGDNQSLKSLKEIYAILNEKKYDQVLNTISQYSFNSSEKEYAELVHAEAYFQSGDLPQAILILNKLMKSEDLKIRHKAEFSYARVLIMLEDEVKAKELLKKISLDKANNNHASDADLLLEKLSDIRYKIVTMF